jgi:transcriptional regulator with XRE-family HTH domain
MDYGKAIRIGRAARGLKQADLAARLRIGASQLSLIESGKRQPSLKTLSEISAEMQIPLHLLTILAAEPEDLRKPEMQGRVEEIALSLVRLLAGSDEKQMSLRLDDSEEK